MAKELGKITTDSFIAKLTTALQDDQKITLDERRKLNLAGELLKAPALAKTTPDQRNTLIDMMADGNLDGQEQELLHLLGMNNEDQRRLTGAFVKAGAQVCQTQSKEVSVQEGRVLFY